MELIESHGLIYAGAAVVYGLALRFLPSKYAGYLEKPVEIAHKFLKALADTKGIGEK